MIERTDAESGAPAESAAIIVLTLRLKPGTADAVLAGLSLDRADASDSGNNQFEVFRLTNDTDTLVIIERLHNRQALREYLQLPHTKRALASLGEDLAPPLIESGNILYLAELT